MYSTAFFPRATSPRSSGRGKTIFNLGLPEGVSLAAAEEVALIRELNRASLEREDDELKAASIPTSWPSECKSKRPSLRLSHETRDTLELYGIGAKPTDDYAAAASLLGAWLKRESALSASSRGGIANSNGTRTKTSRRITGAWRKNRSAHGRLLTDLKRRGLLDSTLVLWAASSAAPRKPKRARPRPSQLGFTMWMAGGASAAGKWSARRMKSGSKPSSAVSFRDIHATILHQLGSIKTS